MAADKKFRELNDLPPQPQVPEGANFIQFRKTGKLLTLSGYGPLQGSSIPKQYTGKLGKSVSVKQGYNASRLTAINLLLIARSTIKTLDNIDYILNVEGAVQCTDDFNDQSAVINGCSDFLVEIFGKRGYHTRSAVGTNALAFNICVEISMTLVLK